MGFRFQKRINLGGGLGLNVSKSGISPSLRTKIGTVSNKGVSIKTGLQGVSYRKAINSKGCVVALLLYLTIGFTLYQIIN
jgi:hypothetical protein